MAQKISRRKLAAYAADQIVAGKTLAKTLESIAAYLIDAGRTREASLVVRAIEDELDARGVVIATVTTAHPIDATFKKSLSTLLKADSLHVREVIDESVLGGARVETATTRIDSTVKHAIAKLRAAKL